MGAEQSDQSRKNDNEKYQRMMQNALEKERRAYEQKYKELLEMQQKIQESQAINERNQKQQILEDALKKQREIYKEKYNKLLEEQRTKFSTQTLNEQNLPGNITLNAETQGNYASLYPNLQHVPTVEMGPSTSSGIHYAFSSNSSNRHKSIFCQPSAPSAPNAPETSSMSHQRQRGKPKCKINNDLYQCPSCKLNNLERNIFQCEQGHSSCSQCKVKAVKCGICSSSITDTRNIDLETIIAKLYENKVNITERVNCPNKSDGCSLSFKPENLQGHLKECIFREMQCPIASAKYSTCFWRGKINQLQAHFLEYHSELKGGNVDTEMCFNVDGKQHTIHHITMGKFNFLVHVKLDLNLQNLLMTVQLIGSLNSAAKWTYEFHVYDKSEPRKKFIYADICLPNSMQFSEVANEAKCAVVPIRYAMRFCKNNKLTYKFYIKRDVSIKVPNQRRKNRDRSVQAGNQTRV